MAVTVKTMRSVFCPWLPAEVAAVPVDEAPLVVVVVVVVSVGVAVVVGAAVVVVVVGAGVGGTEVEGEGVVAGQEEATATTPPQVARSKARSHSPLHQAQPETSARQVPHPMWSWQEALALGHCAAAISGESHWLLMGWHLLVVEHHAHKSCMLAVQLPHVVLEGHAVMAVHISEVIFIESGEQSASVTTRHLFDAAQYTHPCLPTHWPQVEPWAAHSASVGRPRGMGV